LGRPAEANLDRPRQRSRRALIRQGEAAFVDSGAWIALALSRDPLHARAREQWDALRRIGARLHTSIPVVIETFTFLERNANRDVALAWREAIYAPGTVKILPCDLRDLEQSWTYFRRRDLHKLSAVDATSFVIMRRARIRIAFTFDHHFAAVGFRQVG
jgi:predicted nucleic acid-binding protein